jgi:hypothetical protein
MSPELHQQKHNNKCIRKGTCGDNEISTSLPLTTPNILTAIAATATATVASDTVNTTTVHIANVPYNCR